MSIRHKNWKLQDIYIIIQLRSCHWLEETCIPEKNSEIHKLITKDALKHSIYTTKHKWNSMIAKFISLNRLQWLAETSIKWNIQTLNFLHCHKSCLKVEDKTKKKHWPVGHYEALKIFRLIFVEFSLIPRFKMTRQNFRN